jgi:2-iminobutanoate/2-iminopropanoate deaminase
MIKTVETKNAPAAIGPYSQAKIAGNLVYLSGQIPIAAETGEMTAGGITEQTELVIKNIGAVLNVAGSGFDKVIKTTCFLTDMNDFGAFNKVYEKYFINKPARSCVAVSALPKGASVEIEIVAEI